MDLKLLVLPFKESGIEWRIGQAGKTGAGGIWATCLAYVSARAIMHRLDEVCGPDGWKVEYSILPQGVICRLSIKCGGEWITKEDGAEQTEIESFKGGISSALKRAGSAWGIGRYLYDLESGFATIVQKNAPGARYAKLPEKIGSDVFYWNPPTLPDWALPSDKEEAPIPPEPPKPRRPWTEQPGLGDAQPGNYETKSVSRKASPIKPRVPKTNEQMAGFEERGVIAHLAQQHGWKMTDVSDLITQLFGVDKVELLTVGQAAEIADTIEAKKPSEVLTLK